jgi:hypothetical protein
MNTQNFDLVNVELTNDIEYLRKVVTNIQDVLLAAYEMRDLNKDYQRLFAEGRPAPEEFYNKVLTKVREQISTIKDCIE